MKEGHDKGRYGTTFNEKSRMNRKIEMTILSDNDVERKHLEPLQILRELGFKFPYRGMLVSFKKMGAEVDLDTQIAGRIQFPIGHGQQKGFFLLFIKYMG
jgi:trimethylamine:corrinoid methyltransferase-like protein